MLQVQLLAASDTALKCAACYLLRSVAKHSEACALAVANAGAVQPLVESLSGSDANLQESAAWTLGYLAQHSVIVAEEVCCCKYIVADSDCIEAVA